MTGLIQDWASKEDTIFFNCPDTQITLNSYGYTDKYKLEECIYEEY